MSILYNLGAKLVAINALFLEWTERFALCKKINISQLWGKVESTASCTEGQGCSVQVEISDKDRG